MSSITVRHGVAVGLGATAGAFAAAALFTTAPIASADDTDFAYPALVPDDEITNTLTIGEGGTKVVYTTTYDFAGLPTTAENIETNPVGTETFGFGDANVTDYTFGTTPAVIVFASELLDTSSAAGNSFDLVTPVFEFLS